MSQRPKDTPVPTGQPAPHDAAEEQRLKSSFWKHLIMGYAIGLSVGALILFFVFIAMQEMQLNVPAIFILAAMAQIGTGGGLVGVGIYLSRNTDRGDDDDGPPSGGRKERVKTLKPARVRPPKLNPGLAGAS